MGLKCYWLVPTRQTRLSLRRFSANSAPDLCPANPGEYSYHNAHAPLFVVNERFVHSGEYNHKVYEYVGPHTREEVPEEYPWPVACACGYVFPEEDRWQVSSDSLFKRADTGEILTWWEAGPGAMYNAEWLAEQACWQGPDGMSIVVKCPDGKEWTIDARCNNCTLPGDDVHKCWVRHGEPPVLTVDKEGITCSAGGGSIDTGTYHGFLRNGEFT